MEINSKFGIYIDKNGLPNNHRIINNEELNYINFFNKKNEDGTFSIMVDNIEQKITKNEVLTKIKEIYENVLDIIYQFNIEKINHSNIPEKLLYTFPEQIPTLYSDSYCYLRKLELAFNNYLYENNYNQIEKTYYKREISPENNLILLKNSLIDLYVYQNIVFEDSNILDEKQNLKFLRNQSTIKTVFDALRECVSEIYDNFRDLEAFKIEERNKNFLDLEINDLSIRKDRINFAVNADLLNSFYIDAERMSLKEEKLDGVYIFVKDSLGFINTTKYDNIEKHVPKPEEKIKSRYEDVTFVNFSHMINSEGNKVKYYDDNLEIVSLNKDLNIISKNFKELLSTIYSLNLMDINSSREDDNPLIKKSLFLINELLKRNNQEKIEIDYKKISEEEAIKKMIECHGQIIVGLDGLNIMEKNLTKNILKVLMTNTFNNINFKNIKDLNTAYFNIYTNEKEEKVLGNINLSTDYYISLDSFSKEIREIKLPEIKKIKRKNNGY